MSTDIQSSESKQTAEAVQEQRGWLCVNLSSIGHAVIIADTYGGVTFLKPVGSALDQLDARGRNEESAARGFQDRQ